MQGTAFKNYAVISGFYQIRQYLKSDFLFQHKIMESIRNPYAGLIRAVR